MQTIKNIHKIAPLLSQEAIEKLNVGASLHKRHAGITFKILTVDGKGIQVQAIQEKNQAGNYLSQKELIARTKDLFTKFLDRKIHVHAVPYEENIITRTVTPAWISKQMLIHKIKSKDIVHETGIDKTNISTWVNGVRPLSQIAKAMFYYYFLNKKS